MGDPIVTDSMLHPEPERLDAFVEGTLDEADRAVVESHLIACDQCQAEIEETRSLFTALAALPHFDPSPGFALRVMQHVKLPDPWYVRAGHYLQIFIPKTTRGWAFASGIFALPLVTVSAMLLWLLSKPYITGETLIAFGWSRISAAAAAAADTLAATFIRSDIAIMTARGVEAAFTGDLRGAGLVALAFAALTCLSTWVLYQNLFRSPTRRSNYASFGI